jgi:hypothetical protein
MKAPLVAVLAAALVLGPAVAADAAPVKTFKNCTALHKVYPHGVGKPGAKDHTSGTRVTTFKKSAKLYAANKKSDRDKDGIACEA